MELVRLTAGDGLARIVRRFLEDGRYMHTADDDIDTAIDPCAPRASAGGHPLHQQPSLAAAAAANLELARCAPCALCRASS